MADSRSFTAFIYIYVEQSWNTTDMDLNVNAKAIYIIHFHMLPCVLKQYDYTQ
jgi:hypothetical protein